MDGSSGSALDLVVVQLANGLELEWKDESSGLWLFGQSGGVGVSVSSESARLGH